MTVNGRHARYYVTGAAGDPDRVWIAVTYHRRIRDRTRQLTVTPKLMAKVIRTVKL